MYPALSKQCKMYCYTRLLVGWKCIYAEVFQVSTYVSYISAADYTLVLEGVRVSVSICPSNCVSICLSSVCLSVCLFVCLFSVLFLSVSLSICLYVYRVCMRLLLLFEDTLIMLLRLAIGTDQGLSVVDTITNKCLYILSNLTSILCKHATSNILAFLYLCLHMCRFDKPRYKKREHSSNLLSQTHCHEASKPAVHVYTTVQSNLFVLCNTSLHTCPLLYIILEWCG